ncbi:MAG: hypothetical protein IIB14_01820 [Chloroflexi bacterium]|nr:hypothetical protein [Chloroflexota bacterium]
MAMLKGNPMDLLHEIFRCPNVRACLEHLHKDGPCAEIILSQGSESPMGHLMPEPWSGRLEKAPILFLSSNPAMGNVNEYPEYSWPDDSVADYFNNRFGGGGKQWIKDGRYPLKKEQTYGGSVGFWSAVKKRASELLEKESVRPGEDYALSEVVHCPSAREFGVKSALEECADRYLRPLLSLSGANVIVCLGRFAKLAVRDKFELPRTGNIHGPIRIGEKMRYFAFLPHPNAWIGPWSFRECLSSEEFRTLQEFLGIRESDFT